MANNYDDEDTPDEIANNRMGLTEEFNYEADIGKDEDKDSYGDNDESSGNNDLDDDDLQSMESGIAVGAGTSRENTPPSSPHLPHVRVHSQFDQIAVPIGAFKRKSSATKNLIGEITDHYDLPFFDHTRNFRMPSKSSVRWKGVDWNILSAIRSHSEVGFFLGFENGEHLPIDWAVCFRYKYEILDENDTVIRGDIFNVLMIFW